MFPHRQRDLQYEAVMCIRSIETREFRLPHSYFRLHVPDDHHFQVGLVDLPGSLLQTRYFQGLCERCEYQGRLVWFGLTDQFGFPRDLPQNVTIYDHLRWFLRRYFQFAGTHSSYHRNGRLDIVLSDVDLFGSHHRHLMSLSLQDSGNLTPSSCPQCYSSTLSSHTPSAWARIC